MEIWKPTTILKSGIYTEEWKFEIEITNNSSEIKTAYNTVYTPLKQAYIPSVSGYTKMAVLAILGIN